LSDHVENFIGYDTRFRAVVIIYNIFLFNQMDTILHTVNNFTPSQ